MRTRRTGTPAATPAQSSNRLEQENDVSSSTQQETEGKIPRLRVLSGRGSGRLLMKGKGTESDNTEAGSIESRCVAGQAKRMAEADITAPVERCKLKQMWNQLENGRSRYLESSREKEKSNKAEIQLPVDKLCCKQPGCNSSS